MSKNERDDHPISGDDLHARFGHFSDGGGNDAGFEPLIARESLRGYLIRRLVFGARQMTCLVTGRRGMGKTSFVKYCLQEYGRYDYERFRRTPGGKSFVDALVLLLIITLSAALAVLVSRVAMVLVMTDNSEGLMLFSQFIGYLLILMLFTSSAFAIKYWSRANRRRRNFGQAIVNGADLIFFLIISTWIAYASRGSPILPLQTAAGMLLIYLPALLWMSSRDGNVSREFVYFASGSGLPLTYLGIAAAILTPVKLTGTGFGQWLFEWAPVVLPVKETVLFAVDTAGSGLGQFALKPAGVDTLDAWLPLVGGAAFFGMAALIASLRVTKWQFLIYIPMVLAFIVVAAVVAMIFKETMKPALGLIALAVVFYIITRFRDIAASLLSAKKIDDASHKKTISLEFRKLRPAEALRAQFTLRLKAMATLAAVATLATPPLMAAHLGRQYVNFSLLHDRSTISLIFFSVAIIVAAEIMAVARVFGPYGACRDIAGRMPCFKNKSDKEKEFIKFWKIEFINCLPKVDEQNDPFHDADIIEWCHKLERSTIAWQYYRVHVPAITVSINLGFDDLDHRKIIHAMLVALRNSYQKAFLDWDSPIAGVIRALGGAGIFVVVVVISASFFPILPVSSTNENRCESRIEVNQFQREKFAELFSTAFRGVYNNLADGPLRNDFMSPPLLTNYAKIQQDLYTSVFGVDENTTNEVFLKFLEDNKASYKNLLNEIRRLGGASSGAISDEYFERVFADITAVLRGKVAMASGAKLLCDTSKRLFDVAYFDVIPMPVSVNAYSDGSLIFMLTRAVFHTDAGRLHDHVSRIVRWEQRETAISVKIYHLILAAIIFLAGRTALGVILPYRANVRRIDDLLDGLTSTSVDSYGSKVWSSARWLRNWFGGPDTRSLQRNPVDSRVIEESFIRVLTECTVSSRALPGGRLMSLGMPAPEITFVFDELDKLWAKPAGRGPRRDSFTVTAERDRAEATARLLSDLKRMISDSPARAIFVGGRMLHDSWVADMHARSQVLTSIFDAEVYVPSLLTDTTDVKKNRNVWMDRLVLAYVDRRYEMALAAAEERERQGDFLLPWFREREPRRMLYLSTTHLKRTDRPKFLIGKAGTQCAPRWERRIRYDLSHYLTYRSGGSPKRLREMLGQLIRPSGDKADVDILVIGPVRLLQMQCVADIYRHLTRRLEQRLAFRDDKVALSAFSLTDHLFKFHRRAFNLANIERMEEIAHIHRAPDIRDLLSEIVNHFQPRYLRPVVNGMYDYRFRSEVAQEIEHLSRYSESEMAAFNFTLDESLSLKASYESMLTDDDTQCVEALAALAELHEYDQEYDHARTYYGRALRALPVPDEGSPYRLAHSLTRLRLMLQVGMNYEQSFNLERAEGEYVATYHLARDILVEFLDVTRRGLYPERDAAKHASLLYQPIFAGAWVAEKLWNDIDTSTARVEAGLVELRAMMPFVCQDDIPLTQSPHQPVHASFALIMSDLHLKAGDLYFVKGRQAAPAVNIAPYAQAMLRAFRDGVTPPQQYEGYLLKAGYHYSLALHEVRRFACHRLHSSAFKLTQRDGTGPTLAAESHPAYAFGSASGAINNLAEALFARVSITGLSMDTVKWSTRADGVSLWKIIQDWMVLNHKEEANNLPVVVQTACGAIDMGLLSDWLGEWEPSGERKLALNRANSPQQRLIFSIELSIAGAEARRAGGASEDAASEHLLVARSCAEILWYLRIRRHVIPGERQNCGNLVSYLSITGLECLRTASTLLMEVKRDRFQQCPPKSGRPLKIGTLIPAEALTLACSLGLAMDDMDYRGDFETKLMSLLKSWSVEYPNPCQRLGLRSLLFNQLRENRYPVLNRLIGIKVLLDSALTDPNPPSSNASADKKRVIPDFERLADKEMVHRFFCEFEDVFRRFASPALFGFSQAGQTAALYTLYVNSHTDRLLEGPFCNRREIYRVALEWLRQGIEMFTQGPAYYQAIRNMYYLHDDFNDRRTHHARAIEMAGWEVSAQLIESLEAQSIARR